VSAARRSTDQLEFPLEYPVLNPNAQKLMVLGLVVAVGMGASLIVHVSIRRKAKRCVADRRPLGNNDFAALFATRAEAEVAPLIRLLLRGYIPVAPELVHPDDKLCRDLGLAAVDGLDANSFVADVQRAVGVSIPDAIGAKMLTLRDVVSYVALRRSEKF
jgi:hypothetical protein